MTYDIFYQTISPLIIKVYNPALTERERLSAFQQVRKLQHQHAGHAHKHFVEITTHDEGNKDNG